MDTGCYSTDTGSSFMTRDHITTLANSDLHDP